jgi:hypothetical protein
VLIGRHIPGTIRGRRSADIFIQSGGSIKQRLGEDFFSLKIVRFFKKRQDSAAKKFSLNARDIRGPNQVHAWHSLSDANEDVCISVYCTAACGAGTALIRCWIMLPARSHESSSAIPGSDPEQLDCQF